MDDMSFMFGKASAQTFSQRYGDGDGRRYRIVEPHHVVHNSRSSGRVRSERQSCDGGRDVRSGGRSTRSEPVGKGHGGKVPAVEDKVRAAARWKIPKGYSLANWDPDERPFFLAGSVFDVNSLGKWIYDWSCYRYGPSSPLADIAGDYWICSIRLDGKLRRLERWKQVEFPGSREARGPLGELLERGLDIWQELVEHIGVCEVSIKATAEFKARRRLTRVSGTAFAEAFLGEQKQLSRTERLAQAMHTWDRQVDAGIEEWKRQ